jgi:hypothetical protein
MVFILNYYYHFMVFILKLFINLPNNFRQIQNVQKKNRESNCLEK